MGNLINTLKRILNAVKIKTGFLVKAIYLGKLVYENQLTKYPPVVNEFEFKFKKFIGSKFALTFSNATTSLDSIIFSLELGKGDHILMSNMTFYSVVMSFLQNGLYIDFLDFDSNLDIILPKKSIHPKTKLIVVSHLFGIPSNMHAIQNFARKNKLKIIEDCSHAHGASYNGKKVGSIADASFFSLQGYKPISGGEGGIVTTNDKNIYDKLRLYSHMGRDMSDVEIKNKIFKTIGLGRKGRMHPLAAGLALIDLKSINKRNRTLKIKYKEFVDFIKKYISVKVINLEKNKEIGGFYYGIPFWLVSEDYELIKERLLNSNKIKVNPYPFPNYSKNSTFINPEKFFLTVNDKNNNMSDLIVDNNFKNANFAISNLLFLDIKSLRNFGIKEKKEIHQILK